MELAAYRSRIARSGVLLPEADFRLLSALFVRDDEGVSRLLGAARGECDLLFDVLELHGLCGWALERLGVPVKGHGALERRLQAGQAREFAACALRRLALQQLDAACAGCASPPILIKGAANAVCHYERESMRPSQDIDVMLRPDDASRCFPAETALPCEEEPAWGPAHHAPPFKLAGYEVEIHQFLSTPGMWGKYADLQANASPLPGFQHLHATAPVEAFTIALLHFNFHVGNFTYDFFDLDRIAMHPEFSWEQAESLWRSNKLTANVLPPLAIFEALAQLPESGRWNRLYSGLGPWERVEVSIGMRLLASRRFTRLRKDWFCTRLTGWPLLLPLWRRLAGSQRLTREVTGRSTGDPMFWYAHLFALPAKRLLAFWR